MVLAGSGAVAVGVAVVLVEVVVVSSVLVRERFEEDDDFLRLASTASSSLSRLSGLLVDLGGKCGLDVGPPLADSWDDGG